MQVNRPRILAVLPGFIPSTMITVVKPLVNLHRAGRIFARIVLESQAGRNDTDWADAIVLCRNTEPRHAPLLAAAQSRGTPLIYDLDDNLFELPPNCEGLSRLRDASRQAMLEEYLRAAALVRVYSQPLADRVAALNPRVVQTFAPVDMSLVPPPPPAAEPTRPPGPIKIVYATSRTQDPLCEIFWPALARILGRYAGPGRGPFLGLPSAEGSWEGERYRPSYSPSFILPAQRPAPRPDLPIRPLPAAFFPRRIRHRSGPLAGRRLLSLENQQQVPRVRRQRHRRHLFAQRRLFPLCRSTKSPACWCPTMPTDWHDAIERLIEDAALRTRIQQEARQYVREHYAQEKFEQLFLEQIRDVLSMPAESPALAVSRAASPWNATRRLPVPGVARSGNRPIDPARLLPPPGRTGRRSLGTLRRLGPRRAGPRSAGSSTTAAWPPGCAGSFGVRPVGREGRRVSRSRNWPCTLCRFSANFRPSPPTCHIHFGCT